jgi:hypothetical protein
MAQIIPIYIPTYISDQNYNPTRVQPRLLYYNNTVDCETYYIRDGNDVTNAIDLFPYFDNYNVVTGSFPTTDSKSLLFFNEQPVYGSAPATSLFSEYWNPYIQLLYNPRTRLLTMSGIIPLADYFEMELNDIVNFRGNDYHLRAINGYNLSTGQAESIQLLGPILEGSLDRLAPTVFSVTNNSSANYIINGQSNPTLTLSRGKTYIFEVNASGHPFWIKTVSSTGTGNAYNTGVTNNGDDVGTISFDVAYNAPSTLYYNCQYHSGMAGTINVIN